MKPLEHEESSKCFLKNLSTVNTKLATDLFLDASRIADFYTKMIPQIANGSFQDSRSCIVCFHSARLIQTEADRPI